MTLLVNYLCKLAFNVTFVGLKCAERIGVWVQDLRDFSHRRSVLETKSMHIIYLYFCAF